MDVKTAWEKFVEEKTRNVGEEILRDMKIAYYAGWEDHRVCSCGPQTAVDAQEEKNVCLKHANNPVI